MAELFNVCYSPTHTPKMWWCATVVSLLKPGKPCRLVTTKLSSNITLVHYSQTGRIYILMRICNHGVLLLSYQESVSTLLTKSWNSIYWLSQPFQKYHCMGCHPRHPIGDSVCQKVLYWSSVSRSAYLLSDGTCSTEIRIQISSANAAEARLNRIWKRYMSFSTKFKVA